MRFDTIEKVKASYLYTHTKDRVTSLTNDEYAAVLLEEALNPARIKFFDMCDYDAPVLSCAFVFAKSIKGKQFWFALENENG